MMIVSLNNIYCEYYEKIDFLKNVSCGAEFFYNLNEVNNRSITCISDTYNVLAMSYLPKTLSNSFFVDVSYSKTSIDFTIYDFTDFNNIELIYSVVMINYGKFLICCRSSEYLDINLAVDGMFSEQNLRLENIVDGFKYYILEK